MSGDDFRIKLGKGRQQGNSGGRAAKTFVGQVKRAAQRSGLGRGGSRNRKGGSTGHLGRGRSAAFAASRSSYSRRVIIKARIVRRSGMHSAAPLARHAKYLERDGVTADGRDARLFDAGSDFSDADAFAERCSDDRHHFRFIVSPEDAIEMEDLRIFTRELMDDMARDLDTRLDWTAVNHWNTDNPHIHILLRGKADDGGDLIIDKNYIGEGMRARAEERVTIELGPRSERDIGQALAKEVESERWTSLDKQLLRQADQNIGIVDLRPGGTGSDPLRRNLLVGRAMKLETLGLADKIGPACWTLKPDIESTLRDLAIRGDIIKTMHRAMNEQGHRANLSAFALHGDRVSDPIIGRLVERGLHDELSGSAYAVIDGVDGRTHHLKFTDLEMTGDAGPGAIVELRSWEDSIGQTRQSLAVRSDLNIAEQVSAKGATWIDRQLVSRDPVVTGNGFGSEVQDAMSRRGEYLVREGLAKRQGRCFLFARGLLNSLKEREFAETVVRISQRTGLAHQSSKAGDHIAGTYRERVSLASGRFAMIDNGMGFELVPWRPALDKYLGQNIKGRMSAGGIEWNLGRGRGQGI